MKLNFKIIILLILFFSGLYLRFYKINLMEFQSDEANILTFTNKILNGIFISKGIYSSKKFHTSPFINYFFAIPLLIKKNIIFTVKFIAFFNMLSLFLIFFSLQKIKNMFFFNLLIVSSIIFLPSNILFSRKIWPQSNMFFFSSIFLFFLINTIKKPNLFNNLLTSISFSFLLQAHVSTLFIFPVFLYFLLKNKKYFIFNSTLFLLCSLPLINIFINEYNIIFNSIKNNNISFITLINNFYILLQNFDFSYITNLSFNFKILIFFSYLFVTLFSISILKTLFLKNKFSIIYILYFFSIFILFFLTRTKTYSHYFLILLSIIPFFLQNLYSKKKYLNYIIYFILIIFIVQNIFVTFKFYNKINKKYGSYNYGTAYKYKLQAINYLKRINSNNIFLSCGINNYSILPKDIMFLLKNNNIHYNAKTFNSNYKLLLIDKFIITNIKINELKKIGKILYNKGIIIVKYKSINSKNKNIYKKINNNMFINLATNFYIRKFLLTKDKKYLEITKNLNPFF